MPEAIDTVRREQDGFLQRPAGPGSILVAIVTVGVAIGALLSASRGFGSETPEPAPGQLVIAPDLLGKLQTLAAGLHNEIVLCLIGSQSGGTATVDRFFMPTSHVSTATRSTFDACPERTLATWHNHPPLTSAEAKQNTAVTDASARVSSVQLCVLSEGDIETSRRVRHPFAVVSVDAATWCWWSLDEIETLAANGVTPGMPDPDRLAAGPLADARVR